MSLFFLTFQTVQKRVCPGKVSKLYTVIYNNISGA